MNTRGEGRRGEKRMAKVNLEYTRHIAVRMHELGYKADEIADVLECGRSTVYGWIADYTEDGEEGLRTARAPGRPPKVSPEQEARVRAVLKLNPRPFGFDFELWSQAMVAQVVEREFGVSLSASAAGALPHRMGMSPQKPVVRAYERDPERIRCWTDQEFPAIRQRAAEEGARILFADEAGVRSDFHAGTTWAPVGVTPVVYATGSRVSVNTASAVAADGTLHFDLVEGTMNAPRFVEFLQGLRRAVPGRLFVVVDGSPIHRATVVSEYVRATEGQLRLFFLPGYAPDLNPDEWVWKSVKPDTVGRAMVKGVGELRNVAAHALERLRQSPELVRSFFGDPHLRYITATG
jgi:transposase